MKKPTLKSTLIGLVLSGILCTVCTNAHMEIFHCDITELDHFSDQSLTEPPKTKTRSGMCSLLSVSRGPSGYDGVTTDESTLDPIGWALAGLWLGVLPFGIGLVIGGRKEEGPPSTGA